MSDHRLPSVLPATEVGVPSASDKAGRFPFSAVGSAVLVVATGLGLVACGGGSASPASVSLSGQAIKGPVSGGQVCAYTLANPRQQIACTTTDSNANYQLALPAGTGEVLLEVTGGSYIDEATGQKVALTSPLRTLTKAGGPIQNVLMTPFTELAVQRTSAASGVGNLTLVGFQTQIGNLETGLGITGLATGNPFGSKSAADITHQKALEAFAKLQNGAGSSVSDALVLIGNQLANCGGESLAATLAAYSAAGTVSVASGGGVMLKAAQVQLAQPAVVTGADLNLYGVRIEIGPRPNVCTDSLVIDGSAKNVSDLYGVIMPTAWATAKSVEITTCGTNQEGLNGKFPEALVKVNGDLHTNTGNLTLVAAGGGITISGATRVSTESGTIYIDGTTSQANGVGVQVIAPAEISAGTGIGAGAKSGEVIITGVGGATYGGGVLIASEATAVQVVQTLGALPPGGAVSITGVRNHWQGKGMMPIDLAASGLTIENGCLRPLSTQAKGFGDISVQIQSQSGLVLNSAATSQNSNVQILNWSSFSVDPGGKTIFTQPSSSTVQLNQVTISGTTQILGTIAGSGSALQLNGAGVTVNSSGGAGSITLVGSK